MKSLKMTAIAIAAMTLVAMLAFSPTGNALGLASTPTLQTTQRSAFMTGVAPGFQGVIDATCLPGETVTGGGFQWGQRQPSGDFVVLIGQQADVTRSSQFTENNPQQWRVTVLNTSSVQNIDIEADVMCGKIVYPPVLF
jgi:hypothetical protein